MSNQMDFLTLPQRPKPRKGVTGLIDLFLPLAVVEALLEVASEALDYAKFAHAGLGLGDTLPNGWLSRKIEL